MGIIYRSRIRVKKEYSPGNGPYPYPSFINASWWATLLEMGIRTKTFEEIPGAIKAVANLPLTLHDRRLSFLKSKRGDMAHSDFLMLLEQKIDQTNFKEWSRDQMCATLFLTYADVEMSKVVTSLISKDKHRSGLWRPALGKRDQRNR